VEGEGLIFNRDSLPVYIGLRYSFSRRDNRFIGVVAMVSLLGMALGVASLITVLAVMNGFSGELRGRILSLVPHLKLEARSGQLADWPELAQRARQMPGVIGVAPYLETKVLLASAGDVRGAVLTAIDPASEAQVSRVGDYMRSGSLQNLQELPYGIVIGSLQARALGVAPGDSLEITVPRLTLTPLGSFPRRKRFTVVGVFEIGAQLDGSHAFISLASGQKLLGTGNSVQGLRLQLADLFEAPGMAAQLNREWGDELRARDWGKSMGSLFAAIRMEKTMMMILLLSVVAVAAFNIVSSLTMAVTEKRSDIAVLRTMGAPASSIMAIFMAQGLMLATIGIGAGALVGVTLALNISEVTLLLEKLLGAKLFNPQVYFISDLPSQLQWRDVFSVTALALCLSLLATLFPAWRATQVAPAEVLRYE
jgi:lipoprotein-releasing system permease protein